MWCRLTAGQAAPLYTNPSPTADISYRGMLEDPPPRLTREGLPGSSGDPAGNSAGSGRPRGVPFPCPAEVTNLARFASLSVEPRGITCGTPAETFCAMENPYLCDECDAQTPELSHPPELMTDWGPRASATCWQSATWRRREPPPAPLRATVRLSWGARPVELAGDLAVAFGPRRPPPGAMLVERSRDRGRTWRPWQWLASDCARAFGMPARGDAPMNAANALQVFCTERYSQTYGLARGERGGAGRDGGTHRRAGVPPRGPRGPPRGPARIPHGHGRAHTAAGAIDGRHGRRRGVTLQRRSKDPPRGPRNLKSVTPGRIGHTPDRASVTTERTSITPEQLVKVLDQMAITLDQMSITLDQMVITLDQMSITPDQMAITLYQMAITLYQMAITLDQMSITLDQIVITLDQMAITLDQISITLDQMVITLDQMAITLDQMAITLDQIVITLDQMSLTLDQMSLTPDQMAITLDQMSLTLDQMSLRLDQMSLTLDQMAITLDQMSLTLDQMAITLDQMAITLDQMAITLDQMSLTLDQMSLRLDQMSITLDQMVITLDQMSLTLDQMAITLDQMVITPDQMSITPDQMSLTLDQMSITLDQMAITLDQMPMTPDRIFSTPTRVLVTPDRILTTLGRINITGCQCHGHSRRCVPVGERALACLSCRHDTWGPRCERCRPGYRRNASARLHEPTACRSCQCEPLGSLHRRCDASGQCDCRPGAAGLNCSRCLPGYHWHGGCRANLCDGALLRCHNGGICHEHSRCLCPPRYGGPHCQRDLCPPGDLGVPHGHGADMGGAPGARRGQTSRGGGPSGPAAAGPPAGGGAPRRPRRWRRRWRRRWGGRCPPCEGIFSSRLAGFVAQAR
ncbi:unnamed protein product [Lampetra fluviatilis]